MESSASDDPFAPRRRPRHRRPRRDRAQPPRQPPGDLLKRRLIAVGVGVGVLVLLLLAVRGCLDARKERAFENYLRDLSSLATTSNQLSGEFFGRLEDPGDASRIEFQDQLGSSRGTGEDLLRRAEGLDAPDELADAQADLELAFELRRDGLSSVVEQIPTALGNSGRGEAFQQIALDMRQFLASDVLYARAKGRIEEVLADEELPGDVPASVFLTDIQFWLDELQLAAELSQVAGSTGQAGVVDRGTELSSVVLKPGNVPLTAGTLNTVSRIPTQIEIAVLNGGAADETDVLVRYELIGSTEPIEGETTIPRIKAAATEAAELPIDGEIPTDEDLTLNVTVFPVPGESIIDNNELTYQVTFG